MLPPGADGSSRVWSTVAAAGRSVYVSSVWNVSNKPGRRLSPPKFDVAYLFAQLVGEDEAGVNDLPVVAVAQLAAVASRPDRVFDRPDRRCQRTRLVVVERTRLPHADDGMVRERGAEHVPGRTLANSSTGRSTTSAAPNGPGSTRNMPARW